MTDCDSVFPGQDWRCERDRHDEGLHRHKNVSWGDSYGDNHQDAEEE